MADSLYHSLVRRLAECAPYERRALIVRFIEEQRRANDLVVPPPGLSFPGREP
jgi:hypothetical protein